MYIHIKGSMFINASFVCCCVEKDQLYFFACSLYYEMFGGKRKVAVDKKETKHHLFCLYSHLDQLHYITVAVNGNHFM